MALGVWLYYLRDFDHSIKHSRRQSTAIETLQSRPTGHKFAYSKISQWRSWCFSKVCLIAVSLGLRQRETAQLSITTSDNRGVATTPDATGSQTSALPPDLPRHKRPRYRPCYPCAPAPSSSAHPLPQRPSSSPHSTRPRPEHVQRPSLQGRH
jgi:hypothetical protein